MTARQPCPLCRKRGFVRLVAVEVHLKHSPKMHVVKRRVSFRAPCRCSWGREWLAQKLRGEDV